MHAKEVVIRSEQLTASIHTTGAELRSLRVGDQQHEVIWQRNPSIWEGSAPILFPIVGGLVNDRCFIDGHGYKIPKHGLVRRKTWDIAQQSERQVTFTVSSTPESKMFYPYDWRLETTFTLGSAELRVDYRLQNLSNGTLPASLGSHPAFNLDFGEDAVGPYYLKFEPLTSLPERYKLLPEGLSKQTFPVPWSNGKLFITPNLFEEDALIFVDTKVETVTMGCFSSEKTLSVDTGGAPDLGIWAKPGAPYVCIEPWHGHNDPIDHNGQFDNKPGLLHIDEGVSFNTYYAIKLNQEWF